MLAKLGAKVRKKGNPVDSVTRRQLAQQVVITDVAKVLDLARHNVELNQLSPGQRRGAVAGFAEVEELEWGAEGYESRIEALASGSPVDWVIAADCCYM